MCLKALPSNQLCHVQWLEIEDKPSEGIISASTMLGDVNDTEWERWCLPGRICCLVENIKKRIYITGIKKTKWGFSRQAGNSPLDCDFILHNPDSSQ